MCVCAGGVKLGMPTAAVAPQPAASGGPTTLQSGLKLGQTAGGGGGGGGGGLQVGQAKGLQIGGLSGVLQLGAAQAGGGLQLGVAQSKGVPLGGAPSSSQGKGLSLGVGTSAVSGLQTTGIGGLGVQNRGGLQLGGLSAATAPSLGFLGGARPGLPPPGTAGGGMGVPPSSTAVTATFRGLGGVDPNAGKPPGDSW